jgi:hypothetical protein
MNGLRLRLINGAHFLITIMLVMSFTLPEASASFVLGKQYLLKPKRQNSSLVWYAVTFDKSITGGLKITLKVFSEKGKSIDYFDDYRDFVSPEIAERCISKFSLTNYRLEFNENRRSELGFETKSLSDVMYIPVKVNYEDGFEDYLVRIRIQSGKFAISTRPLQHGMLTIPDVNAVENLRAEQEKQKQDLKKKEEARKAKLEEEKKKAEEAMRSKQEALIKAAPSVIINDELFNNPEDSSLDNLLKNTESEFKEKEDKAKEKIKPIDEADLYNQPLQTPPEVMNRDQDKVVLPAPILPEAETASPDPMDSLFQDKKADPVKAQLPDVDQVPDLLESPKSQIKEKVKVEEAFDDEIEIEGFDEALEEIERLEKLESK